VHSGREERSGFSSLLCGDGQGAPFDEHPRVMDRFKQKRDTPAIVALAFDLADPPFKGSFLDLDEVAPPYRERSQPHKAILGATRTNVGDDLVIDRNGSPSGAHDREHAPGVAHRFQRFTRTKTSKEISGKERLDHRSPATPDDSLFAQPGQENLRTQRADVVRSHRLPTRFRMDSEPIPLLPKIHLEGRRASSPLQAETCARKKDSKTQANSLMEHDAPVENLFRRCV
jgi:hypothetical protein